MKIVIPTLKDAGPETRISEHFGRAPYFTVITFNPDTGEWSHEIHRNPAQKEHRHGQIPEFVLKFNPDAVIVYHIGPGAISHLSAAGVKIYESRHKTIGEAIRAFHHLELSEITLDSPHHHGHHSGHGHGGFHHHD